VSAHYGSPTPRRPAWCVQPSSPSLPRLGYRSCPRISHLRAVWCFFPRFPPHSRAFQSTNARHTPASSQGLTYMDYKTPVLTEIACPRCGCIETPVVGPGSGPHASAALCRHCGAWPRWLSRYTPAERLARRQQPRQEAMAIRPPSARQLAYLQALGDDGPVPASMAEASTRIDTLLRVEGVQ